MKNQIVKIKIKTINTIKSSKQIVDLLLNVDKSINNLLTIIEKIDDQQFNESIQNCISSIEKFNDSIEIDFESIEIQNQ